MRVACLASLLTPLLVGGCGGSVSEQRSSLSGAIIVSTIELPGGAKAAIERAYTGGATGDTLHKAWICQASLSDCELSATVDTNDGPPPAWRTAPTGLELIVAPTDVVWGFSNFSHLPGPGSRSIKIRLVERPA